MWTRCGQRKQVRQGAEVASCPDDRRTSESTLLAEMWERSVAGAGRVGVIYGEPGIGKSRLSASSAVLSMHLR